VNEKRSRRVTALVLPPILVLDRSRRSQSGPPQVHQKFIAGALSKPVCSSMLPATNAIQGAGATRIVRRRKSWLLITGSHVCPNHSIGPFGLRTPQANFEWPGNEKVLRGENAKGPQPQRIFGGWFRARNAPQKEKTTSAIWPLLTEFSSGITGYSTGSSRSYKIPVPFGWKLALQFAGSLVVGPQDSTERL